MADIRSSFPTLENGSDVGSALAEAVNAVTDPTGLAGSIGFSFKDSSGNVILPTLSASGAVFVDSGSAGTCLTGNAKVAGAASETTVLDISLAAGETYKDLDVTVSNFRDTIYKITHVNDPAGSPTVTELGEILCGPGQYSNHINHECMEFVAGATDPVLRITGENLNAASDFRAIASLLQLA